MDPATLNSTADLTSERPAPTRCPMCGGRNTEDEFRVTDDVAYLACPCGVTYPDQQPTPQELLDIYASGYTELQLPGHGLHQRYKPGYRQAYAWERDMTLDEIGASPARLRGRRILDVGCAQGIFLDYLRAHEVEAAGIDISSEMVGQARQNGLDARTGTLDDVEGRYDVLCLWDVLEHLLDTDRQLARIAELVRPGGELLIQTPCTGVVSDAFGGRWRNFIYPQHVCLFSERGLVDHLARHGFVIEQRTRFGSGNTAGSVPTDVKRAMDAAFKRLGQGDTIALRAVRLAD